jgi:Zn-dependent peptidase ImmA (M78 family)
MNLGKAKSAAAQLLKKYRVKKAPVEVASIANGQGMSIKYHEMEDNLSGILIDRPPEIVIVVNSRHHPNRQRFTIAHELAHFSLHRGDPTVFVDKYLVHFRADSPQGDPFDPREAEANQFASCLLMPEALLKKDLKGQSIDLLDDAAVRGLATRYQVSVQALSIRLERLGLLGSY